MTINALTREQKLLAEIVVQLGNITEAIQVASAGQEATDLKQKITYLQSQLTDLAQERAELTEQLSASNHAIADLTAQLASHTNQDLTPDTVAEVMSHLGIDYDPGNNTQSSGNTGY